MKSSFSSYECMSCDAEFDLVPTSPAAYTEVLYCPYCGSEIEPPDTETPDWEKDYED